MSKREHDNASDWVALVWNTWRGTLSTHTGASITERPLANKLPLDRRSPSDTRLWAVKR